MPVLATCAGLILLAKEAEGGKVQLGTMDIAARRNAYGRQLGSFETVQEVKGFGDFDMVFIRAPYIETAADGVDVLAKVDGNIVAVQYKNQIGLSFHPELGNDYRIHQHFLDLIK